MQEGFYTRSSGTQIWIVKINLSLYPFRSVQINLGKISKDISLPNTPFNPFPAPSGTGKESELARYKTL